MVYSGFLPLLHLKPQSRLTHHLEKSCVYNSTPIASYAQVLTSHHEHILTVVTPVSRNFSNLPQSTLFFVPLKLLLYL